MLKRSLADRLDHISQRAAFAWVLLRKGKLTPTKLLNASRNKRAYRSGAKISGRYPTVSVFDTSNRCNIYCVACRRTTLDIIDVTGQTEVTIPQGNMTPEHFQRVVDQVHRHMTLAVLYVSGEPLMNKNIYDMVAYASQRKLGTLLSTNGMLLTEKASQRLIDADLDYLKVAVSGWSQDVHKIYHRGSEIGTVLDNLKRFNEMRKAKGVPMRVVLDYITFEHNLHELPRLRQFCRETGLAMTVRAGRTRFQDGIETPHGYEDHYDPKATPCDWLWNVMAFSWDGNALPCCEFATHAAPTVMGKVADEDLSAIWNGANYQAWRRSHAGGGRPTMAVCDKCHYSGVDFQS